MNKRLISLTTFVCLLFTSVSYSQDLPRSVFSTADQSKVSDTKEIFDVPKQAILGAYLPIPLGEMVDLSLSPIEHRSPALIACDYKWAVSEIGIGKNGQLDLQYKRVREVNDGVVFGSGVKPKKLFVTCTCVYLFLLKDKDGKVSQVSTRTVVIDKTVIIGEETPVPPQPPVPNPVDPVFLPGRYNLSKTSYDLANKYVTDVSAKTNGSKAYSQVYAGLASEIFTSGKQFTLEAGLKEASKRGTQALTDIKVNPIVWSSFGDALQDYLYKFYQDKKMVTAKDLAEALKEIADGLAQVK